ncbi:hypothetical protein Tco_0300137 [Tanacetum coccineum]
MIEKNKVEADRQFAEIMNALKALQPPTTLPAAIPRFEENSGQSFSSVKVEKEGKDIGFLGALVTSSEVADGYGGEKLPQTADSMLKNLNSEDISTCIRSPESINNQESRITIGEGDQSRVPEKNGLHCDLGRGHERRTWNPWIIYHQPGRNWNIVFQHFELLDDRHAKRALQRKVWDPGLARRDILKQHLEDKVVFQGAGDDMNRCLLLVSKKMEQFKIDQLEANLEQFKIDQAAINLEVVKQRDLLRATIEKNKVEADRQFTKTMNALKSLQPHTTLPAAIPRFEENNGQIADGCGGENLPQTADNMLKNLNSEDINTCIGSLESINNQESKITIGEGDQSRVPEKNVPSHVPRKQQLGGLIFDAEVEIPVGFDLRTFEGLHCDLGRGHERRTWNPGIIYHQPGRNWNIVFQHFELLDDRHAKRALQRKVWDPGLAHRDILKQHLEDKVVFQGAGDDMNRFEKFLVRFDLRTFEGFIVIWMGNTKKNMDLTIGSIYHQPRKNTGNNAVTTHFELLDDTTCEDEHFKGDTQKSVKDFTGQLFGTTFSKFSPTPPRDPTPPREFYNQIKEMKRWAELKDQEKKSEEELMKLLNPATIKAQALKWEEHEEKKAKMLNEFNKCISERTYPLPITKIIYVVNSSKTATIRITRDKDPLNLRVYPNFKLKMMGFSEWLEWVLNQEKRLGLPPPPELATFGLTTEEKKRKRLEFIKEVFVTEDARVDGMNRNLIPPLGVVPIDGLVIEEPES